MEISRPYIIDLSSNNNFVQIDGMQGDGHSVRYVQIKLIANGQQYVINPEEVDVSIMGTKPDTKEIWNVCEITDDGLIKVEITQQMLAVPGRGEYIIMVTHNLQNKQLKSFPFFVITTKAPFDATYIESSDEFQKLVAANHDARIYAAEAKLSELAAKESEENAKVSEDNAKISETNAKDSETNAKVSETNAKASEDNAKASENAAAQSEANAATSEINAKDSEDAAKVSEDNAKASEDAAKVSEDNAKTSELASAQSEANAATSEANAKVSEDNAKASEDAAALSEQNAFQSEVNAAGSETNAENSANLSKSYAVGTNGAVRPNDSTDNSEYYSRMASNSATTAQSILTNVIQEGQNAVDAIQNALDIAAPNFVYDTATGHLFYDGGRFDFEVISNGHLMWGMTI